MFTGASATVLSSRLLSRSASVRLIGLSINGRVGGAGPPRVSCFHKFTRRQLLSSYLAYRPTSFPSDSLKIVLRLTIMTAVARSSLPRSLLVGRSRLLRIQIYEDVLADEKRFEGYAKVCQWEI